MVSSPSESPLSPASRQRSAQGMLAEPQDEPTSYVSAEGGIAEVVLVALKTSHREQIPFSWEWSFAFQVQI